MENMGDNEEVILTLRKSRKAFMVEYLCALLLLLFFLGIYMVRGTVPGFLAYYIVGMAALSLVSAEGSRLFQRYVITPHKVTVVKGIIKQNNKNVYFRSLGFVLDFNLKQNHLQRILNYGTIFAESQSGGGEKSFEIKDVDNPRQIITMMEKLIEKARRRV